MAKSNKIISLLLSVIMIMSVFSIVPFTANADEKSIAETGAESGTTGDCTWSLDNGVLTISGNGEMGDYDSTYKNGSWVTTAPWGGYDFDAVTIEDGVKSIGSYAFYKCTGLTSVNIPDSVTSIGESAFYKCTGLTSVDIPDSVTSIGNSAFDGCTGLMSVDIPDSVTSIGDVAFYGCTGLTSIDIPDSVTYIGWYAFEGCTGLTSVDIPDSVTSIGSSAFEYTAWYNNQPDGLVYAGKVAYKMKGDCPSGVVIKDGTLSIADYAFSGCTSLTSIDIPDSVTSIGEYAFRGCKGLTSVTIPDSVTSIGDYAFYGCKGLKSIDIPDSVTSIGGSAFYDTAWYNNQPYGDLIYAGKVAYKMKGDGPSVVVIKDGTLGIADSAFYWCTGPTSVTIPDSVTSIGDSAFYGCTRLTSITIPDSVTSIGSSAFGYYNDSNQVVVKVNDFTIYGKVGSDAERYAKNNGFTFTALDEPEVNSGTTGDCTWEIKDGVLTISGNGRMGEYEDEYNDQKGTNMTTAPWGSYSINSVVIQNGVTDIGSYAFDGLTELKSVTIGNSVTSIGVEAFRYCKGLTAIEIPGSVKSIDARAFYDCLGLTSIEIPNSVISIGNYAFSGCMRAKSITIPDSVTSIGEGAFTECAPITSVTIPGSVTSIGSKAFGYVYGSKKTDFIIYGYEGSEAEKYAKDNEFTFVPLKDKADTTTGIILAVPEDTELTVKDITSEIICDLPDGCNKMTAYNIFLIKDGETVQPGNIVTVKIPCANENAKVYRFEANSTMTDMNAKYKDGYMVFTTDHFSVYVLAEPEPEVVAVPGDVTGDGKTNVQDCTAILRYVRKLDTLTEDQLKRADVTGDGKVNVQDVTRILRHVRKIEELY